jgi:predicted metalloprotease with PDZ domain
MMHPVGNAVPIRDTTAMRTYAAEPRLTATAVLLLGLILAGPAAAQSPILYRLSFPSPEHRWMQVEVTFPDVPPGALQVRMSRSSPGRYALHEFAKNVFDVRVTDASGSALTVARPSLHQWDVTGHTGTVRVSYKVFGDRIDGTYLAIDSTHAHINMPSALMWARGLEERAATVAFEPPAGAPWRVATQLLPGADPFTFFAPNLQYLMDSPAEFSDFGLQTFRVADAPGEPLFRVAIHHQGSDAELESFARDVQKIVAETRQVFGEFPAFEGNAYTFIGDYVRWAGGDAMEHRNSTFLTSPSSIRTDRSGLLGSISHEFFHAWNVERIRPRSLEPFDFEDVNVSRELWLAEGVTNYYGPLILKRAGLISLEEFTRELADVINSVVLAPGRRIRSAEEMSALAPFVDAAVSIDRTNWGNTFISYYTWGQAIGLGLDLSLRDRTRGRVTLDDFMRVLWQRFGKPGGRRPGHVDSPYTAEDIRAALASVSGDAAFADDFMRRYVQGHEVVAYGPLLRRAGLVLRPQAPGQGFAGEFRLQEVGGAARIISSVPMGSPAYEAGLERDDVILSVGGSDVSSASDVDREFRSRRPGEEVRVVFERRGQRVTSIVRLIADPRQELAPVEETGSAPTPAELEFREAWLDAVGVRAF